MTKYFQKLILSIALNLFFWGGLVSTTGFSNFSDNHVLAAGPLETAAVIYDDSLAIDWQDWSWNVTMDFANASPKFTGNTSMAVTFDAPWAGVSLHAPHKLHTKLYSAINFRIHGGSSGTRALRIFIYPEADKDEASFSVPFDAPAGTWTEMTIALSDLGSPPTIDRINIQDVTGALQPTFYIDDMRLINKQDAENLMGTITINTYDTVATVDSRIFGTNLPAVIGATNLADPTFIARTKASGTAVLRMPGSSWSNQYGWLSCERGMNVPNALPCDTEEWPDGVARPSDYIDFLQATGNDGIWTISANGTSKEAAAAVAFFNASVDDTTLIGVDIRGTDWYTAGHWAQLRAAGGNPEPIGINVWTVGSELFGGTLESGTDCLEHGWEDVWTCDGTEYVNGIDGKEGYLAFRNAMRAVDSSILVGAVGVSYSESYNNWGNEVVAAAGSVMDFYDIHQYGFSHKPFTYREALYEPQDTWPIIIADIQKSFSTYAGGRTIPISVLEYNLITEPELDTEQLMTRAVNALFNADTIGQMIQNGVTMANQWSLANNIEPNGTDYSLMQKDNGWYRSPQYYLYPLWTRFGSQMLGVVSSLDAATQLSVYGGRVDEETVSLMAINKTSAPISTEISIRDSEGMHTITGGTIEQMQAGSLATQSITYNQVENPSDDLSNALPQSLEGIGRQVSYTFPPNSITLLRIQSEPVTDMLVFLPLIIK